MGYHPYCGYATSREPRFIAQWGLQWQLLDCQRIEPAADLRAAMAAAIDRAAAAGWQIEADAPFGFVFINRAGERRLLTLTCRDPQKDSPQTFNPFR